MSKRKWWQFWLSDQEEIHPYQYLFDQFPAIINNIILSYLPLQDLKSLATDQDFSDRAIVQRHPCWLEYFLHTYGGHLITNHGRPRLPTNFELAPLTWFDVFDHFQRYAWADFDGCPVPATRRCYRCRSGENSKAWFIHWIPSPFHIPSEIEFIETYRYFGGHLLQYRSFDNYQGLNIQYFSGCFRAYCLHKFMNSHPALTQLLSEITGDQIIPHSFRPAISD